MLKRIKEAIEAGRNAVAEAETPVAPKPGVLALIVLDELGDGAAPVRQRHAQAAQSQGAKPLLILGPLSDHEHPRNGDLREYLPRLEDLARTTAARPDALTHYLSARLSLILDKWDVRECRYIGETAAELVEVALQDKSRRPVNFLPAL